MKVTFDVFREFWEDVDISLVPRCSNISYTWPGYEVNADI